MPKINSGTGSEGGIITPLVGITEPIASRLVIVTSMILVYPLKLFPSPIVVVLP